MIFRNKIGVPHPPSGSPLSAWTRPVTIGFFVCFLVLGLTTVKDYGIQWDELQSHYFGVRWYDYVHQVLFKGAPIAPMRDATEHDIVHGPVVEMTFAAIEAVKFNPTDLRNIVFFRHYGTWTIFYLGTLCFYFLARKFFASRNLALLATLFLVIHPRIYAHAFYDSVDTPFLAFYIFSLYTLFDYIEKRTLGALFRHAVVTALLIDIRSMGAIIPAITGAVLAMEWVDWKRFGLRPWSHLGRIALYFGVLSGTVVLFWPYLWTNPWSRTLEVIQRTAHVSWEGPVLYLGEFVKATQLPWHYLPVWIAITTPIAFTIFFVIGLSESTCALARNPRRFYRERLKELVVLAAVILPILAVILPKAVVFDAWRHLFFVYPPFVLVAIAGVRWTWAGIERTARGRWRTGLRLAVAAAIAVNIATAGWFLIRYHPYGNVYFNRLAGRDMPQIKQRFEMDYWGLSYQEALHYVLRHDPDPAIKIHDENNALLIINTYMLAPADGARIKSVGSDEAKYVFTNYRWRPQGYPNLKEYFSVRVEGEPIAGVYLAH